MMMVDVDAPEENSLSFYASENYPNRWDTQTGREKVFATFFFIFVSIRTDNRKTFIPRILQMDRECAESDREHDYIE